MVRKENGAHHIQPQVAGVMDRALEASARTPSLALWFLKDADFSGPGDSAELTWSPGVYVWI